MAMTFRLNGTLTTKVAKGTFRFEEQLQSRNTGLVVFEDVLGGVVAPKHGHTFEIQKNGTTTFAGRIQQPTRRLLGLSHLEYTCPLVDYSEALDRRLVAREYDNQTLAQIVTDIVTKDLSGEGITTGGVETGPTFARIQFPYWTVQECFNELGRRSGYFHWVDYDKVLNFRDRASVTSPVTLTEKTMFHVRVTEQTESYRNVQLLRAGTDLTDPRPETFKGDGETRTVVVAFPIGKVPTVQEDRGAGFVSKTVGIGGVDPEGTKDWYWNKASNEVHQDPAGTVLSATDRVRVTYQGMIPIMISSELDDEIANRKAVEGSSGRYEAIDHDASIDDDEVAIDKAAALLARHGLIADRVQCLTHEDGLRAGHLVTITHPRLTLSGAYLIESVAGRIVNPDRLEYEVTAVGGSAVGEWQRFFQELAVLRAAEEPRENEVLLLVRKQADEVFCHDVLNPISEAAADVVARVDVHRVGFSEVG